MQKLGDKSISVPPGEKVEEMRPPLPPPSTPGLLSLTSSGIKNKRTELGVKSLALCNTKVGGGGQKH